MRIITFCYQVLIMLCLMMYVESFAIAAQMGKKALPPTGFGMILDWHCVKEKNICLAVGYDTINNQNVPVLLRSTTLFDGWKIVDISQIASIGRLIKTACSWDSAFCIALGVKPVSGEPFLLQSTDNLTTWTSVVLPIEYYKTIAMTMAACTGRDRSSFCMIAGTFNQGSSPVIMQSLDFGKIWQSYDFLESIKSLKVNNTPYQLSSASCAGNDNQTTCIIYGKTTMPNQNNYYAFTNNRGNLWEFKFEIL